MKLKNLWIPYYQYFIFTALFKILRIKILKYNFTLWDLMFSRREVWSLNSSGLYRRVVMLKWADVSEVRTASIIRATFHQWSADHVWQTLHYKILGLYAELFDIQRMYCTRDLLHIEKTSGVSVSYTLQRKPGIL
jgi:hypothetical protein